MNVIRNILSQIMNKESLSRLILIIENPMTNPAMKVVEDSPFKTEIFQVKYVFFLVFFGVNSSIARTKHGTYLAIINMCASFALDMLG